MGCLKAMFAQIGCLVVLLLAGALAFVYREQVADAYRRLRGLPPDTAATWVMPAPGDGARAAAAIAQLARPGGPAYVDLDAGALAALIDGELRRVPGGGFDSLAVSLRNGEVQVRGLLDLSSVPRGALGPFAGALDRAEPVTLGGTLAGDSAGHVTLTVTALQVRDFPFPRSTIGAVLRALHVDATREGAVRLPFDPSVGDVRVRPNVVRLYRAAPR